MAKRLTPEEKVARDLQRKLDKVAARETLRLQREAAWEAERQAKRDAFEAGLSSRERSALDTILIPSGERRLDMDSEVMIPTFQSEFIESLYNQRKNYGFLSAAQLAPIVRAYDQKVEFEAQKVTWPPITEGQEVAVLCKVLSMEVRQGNYGPSTKIKMKSHYGRIFHVNTMAQRFLSVARQALDGEIPLNVQGKAGWVSPDTKIVVLDKKGLYFQEL